MIAGWYSMEKSVLLTEMFKKFFFDYDCDAMYFPYIICRLWQGYKIVTKRK